MGPVLWIDIYLSTSCEIASRWISLNPIDVSTLVQAMAWCQQATSHYLSQCWPRSLLQYDITRPQWVNLPWWFPAPALHLQQHRLDWGPQNSGCKTNIKSCRKSYLSKIKLLLCFGEKVDCKKKEKQEKKVTESNSWEDVSRITRTCLLKW